jgi:hypothetical protein
MKKKSLAQKAADLLFAIDKKHNLAVNDPQIHKKIHELIDQIAEEDVLEEPPSDLKGYDDDEWYDDNGY